MNQSPERIHEISVADLESEMDVEKLTWIDVREDHEVISGQIAKSLHLAKSRMEFEYETLGLDPEQRIIVYCQSGVRSLIAAKFLASLGYKNVSSLKGGYIAWTDFQESKTSRLNADDRQRYQRHFRLEEIGFIGQEKLKHSKVAIVGAGGLGSPIALYLAAAGIGTIHIVDDDLIEKSNLQRQILHKDRDNGNSKALSAQTALRELNPNINVIAHEQRLNDDNAMDLFSGCDIILDGSDNYSTRYTINDTCFKLGIPHVHGSILKFQGQISVFWPQAGSHAPCYRCLFPEPPPPSMSPSCSSAGVVGALPGIIGSMQALEAIKVLLGIGQALIGRLLRFDGLSHQYQELKLQKDPECSLCSSIDTYKPPEPLGNSFTQAT